MMLPNWDAGAKEDRTGLAALLDLDSESQITPAMITQPLVVTDAANESETTYSVAALQQAAKDADKDKDGKTTRGEWRAAQAKDWFYIWLWPGIGAFVTCLVFIVGFRQPATHTETAQEP